MSNSRICPSARYVGSQEVDEVCTGTWCISLMARRYSARQTDVDVCPWGTVPRHADSMYIEWPTNSLPRKTRHDTERCETSASYFECL